MIPIYKKDDAETFSNYQTVSLIPFSPKTLKRLVFNRCVEYIDDHEILNDKRFVFRPNHSTYMAIIELLDKVTKVVEKINRTLGIFLDLSKAFDDIVHNIILHIFEHYIKKSRNQEISK